MTLRASATQDSAFAPVVFHLVREYARPTETFIVNQTAIHHAYEPTVLCHRRLPLAPRSTLGEDAPLVAYESSRRPGAVGRAAYRRARLMLPAEKRFWAEYLSRVGVRVAHAHYGTDALFFLDSVRRARRPLVVSFYGYDVAAFPRGFAGLGRRYLQRLWAYPALYLAMTPQMADDLERLGAPRDRVRVHHFGIDTEFWSAPKGLGGTARPHILHVGSFIPKKGQDDLLRAFARVATLHPDVDVRLVGSGPRETTLRDLARDLGIADRVHFAGFVAYGAGLQREYARALLFCHPSKTGPNGDREGLPGTILEAMACGLPVVSTRHAGIPTAVIEGKTGLLASEGDVADLAEALDTMLGDVALRESCGRAGRRQVEQEFDARVQARRVESIYDEVVFGGARRP